jgi:hypothetical protein
MRLLIRLAPKSYFTYLLYQSNFKSARNSMLAIVPTYRCFFFFFHLIVGVEESFVNSLYRLRITDQLFKSYVLHEWCIHNRLSTPTTRRNFKTPGTYNVSVSQNCRTNYLLPHRGWKKCFRQKNQLFLLLFGRSGDITCSSVAAVETLVHSKPWLLYKSTVKHVLNLND